MSQLFEQAGKAFLHAFIGSLVVLLPTVLSVPVGHNMYSVGVAALISALVAGIQAIQVFVPQLTFASIWKSNYTPVLDAFVRAFLASLLLLIPGILHAASFGDAKVLAIAALIAAVTAGVKSVEIFLDTKNVSVKPLVISRGK